MSTSGVAGSKCMASLACIHNKPWNQLNHAGMLTCKSPRCRSLMPVISATVYVLHRNTEAHKGTSTHSPHVAHILWSQLTRLCSSIVSVFQEFWKWPVKWPDMPCGLLWLLCSVPFGLVLPSLSLSHFILSVSCRLLYVCIGIPLADSFVL